MAVVIVKRRLDDLNSGSGEYLRACLEVLDAAGFDHRIVCAPVAGFGSRVYSKPALDAVTWPCTLRIGGVFLSRSGKVWRRSLHRLWRQARWLIGGRRGDRPSIPSDLSQTLGEVEAADVVAAVNHLSPALVVAEYSSTAPLLAECDVPLRAVLLHDVFALRARAFADHAIPPDHARLSVDQEQRRVAAANICIYASLREKATLSKGLPGQTHIWLPPRVATCDYPEESDPFAVFVGVRHGGNTDSLHMLLNDIWPRVLDQHPEAKLRIAGEICEAVSCPPRGVTLLGHVPDLGSVGGPDAIGLAPVRAASGVSIKVANYLGCGMSVLASPPALDGYDDTLSDLVQIADDPDSFADALVALFKNHTLRRQRARRGVRELPGRLDNRDIVSVLSSMAMRAGAVEKPKSEQNLTCAS